MTEHLGSCGRMPEALQVAATGELDIEKLVAEQADPCRSE